MSRSTIAFGLVVAGVLAGCGGRANSRPSLTVTTVPRTLAITAEPAPPPDSTEWLAIGPLRLEERQLNLEVTNRSTQDVSVKWGDAALVGLDGARQGLEVTNLKLDARGTLPLPSRLPPYSVVQVRMTPEHGPRFPATVADSAEAHRLCAELGQREMRVILPAQRGREKRVYTIHFATDVHLTMTVASRSSTFDCARS